MQKTTNYNLNQWEAADTLQREDFNQDNAAIDAAIKAVADTANGKASAESVTALATQITACGNCRVAYGTYTGSGKNGSATPTGVTVDFYPVLIVVGTAKGSGTFYWPSIYMRPCTSGINDSGRGISVSWGSDRVQWYSDSYDQNNAEGTVYAYVVIGYSV